MWFRTFPSRCLSRHKKHSESADVLICVSIQFLQQKWFLQFVHGILSPVLSIQITQTPVHEGASDALLAGEIKELI